MPCNHFILCCPILLLPSIFLSIRSCSMSWLSASVGQSIGSAISSVLIINFSMETVADFILGGSKTTADADCSHEVKNHLLLIRKATTNLHSIFKPRDITLPTKVCQSYGFSSSYVWMWELYHKESWAMKNWRFWTVMLEKTLKHPLDCKLIKPVILKAISPEYSLEGLMLKLKLQYFIHLMRINDSLEKRPWC